MSTINVGTNNQTVYGSSDNELFVVSSDSGVIYNIGGEDTISVGGAISQASVDGEDVVFSIGDGKLTVKNGKGKYLNVADSNGEYAATLYGGHYQTTPQQVIRTFMNSLESTNLTGSDAIDQAIRDCSDFTSLQDLIDRMLSDCRSVNDADTFLRDYCGIIIDNADTGAVSGWDMGGSTVKTKESVVPESGSFDDFSGTNFSIDGLNVYLSGSTYDNLSDDKKNIWHGLHTWWIEQGLKLIEESYGSSFSFGSDGSAQAHNWYIEFPDTMPYGWSASTGVYKSINMIYTGISMEYFGGTNGYNSNGYSTNSSEYLDRTIAHEMTHAVMGACIADSVYDAIPLYLEEGMSELTIGADARRQSDFTTLASDADKLQSALGDSAGTTVDGVNSPIYSSGYMLLKYLAQQASTFNAETTYLNSSSDELPSGMQKFGDTIYVDSTYDGDVWLTGYDILNQRATYADAGAIGLNAMVDMTAGRILVGNAQSNEIRAGFRGSWMWGWLGDDTLIGGSGEDMFWFGKGEGSDVIDGCNDDDLINLWSINLSDIASFDIDSDDNISVGFSDGNRLKINTIGSSTTFQLADVGRWKLDHGSRSFSYVPT